MSSTDLPSTAASGWVDPSTGRRLPERIGRYRIVSRLGEGGMGVVFEAEQESPRRTVALKVLATGVLSEEAERRFAREAEVLGRLQHPGIAQVFEAGSFASELGPQPFFAMELVRGEPLTRYADKHRLGTRERLELVARIADAVEHAHARGVVHRDLKPANVLVEEGGQPKVLDFGVARATDADVRNATLRTDMGQLLGTIPYMSPEQAGGDPSQLDARSDVYALGVVLYELLAGRLPYELGGLMVHEAVRVVREEEARPLSTLNATLRGDVDTIVTKALEKDRERRYPSAAALAADLRRFLSHQPIEARRQSTLYRVAKFTRRNRGLVAGLAGVFAALLLGLVGTSLGLLEARHQRDEARAAGERASAEERRASAQAERAERTASFLKRLLDGIDPAFAQGADTTLLRRILADTEARIGTELADLPVAQADIQNTIGMTYLAIGEGQTGLAHLRASLATWQRELGPEAPQTIQSLANVGAALRQVSRLGEAQDELRRAAALAHRALGDEHVTTLLIDNSLATALFEAGHVDEAHALVARTLPIQRRVAGADDEATLATLATLGTTLLQLRRWDEADGVLAELHERSQRVRGPDHPQTLKVLNNLAGLASNRGRLDEGLALQREACERSARVNGPAHPLTLELLMHLGNKLSNAGRWGEAESVLRAAWQDSARTNGPAHRATLSAQQSVATLLRESGRHAEAALLLGELIAAWERTGDVDVRQRQRAMLALAMSHTSTKRWDEAEALFDELLASLAAPDAPDATPGSSVLAGAGSDATEEGDLFYDALGGLGALQLARGRAEEAEASYRRCLEFARQQFGGGDRGLANMQSGLALALVYQQRFDEAEPLLRAAIELQTRVLGTKHPDTLTSLFNLGCCLWRAGNAAGALPLVVQAAEGWQAVGGDQHPSSAQTRRILLEILAELDEPAQEEPWRRTELELARSTLAADSVALGQPLAALARTLLAQGELEEARALLEEATLAQAPLPLEDWRVSWTNVLLGGVLAAQDQPDQAALLWEGSEAGLRGAPRHIQGYARGIVEAWRSAAELGGSPPSSGG